MNATLTTTQDETRVIAQSIRKAATPGVLMSLGARDFVHGRDEDGRVFLQFLATILPFNKDGKRSERPRAMYVTVTRVPGDIHKINVTYPARGEFVTHVEGLTIDLPTVLLALDYDGPQVLNPRLVPED